jgi:hypothetical protein
MYGKFCWAQFGPGTATLFAVSAGRASAGADGRQFKALRNQQNIVSSSAIPAIGEMSLEYPILIPTLTGVVHGMQATWWAQSAPSNPAMFGQFGSISMSIDDYGIATLFLFGDQQKTKGV